MTSVYMYGVCMYSISGIPSASSILLLELVEAECVNVLSHNLNLWGCELISGTER